VNQNLLYHVCSFAGAIPYVAISGILVHYAVRRMRYKRAVRRGSIPGFYPSSAALGAVFLLSTMLFRPRLQYAIEAQQIEQAEDDDEGDQDYPGKLDKQLKRIRKGEPVETLVFRL
jgi:hypothetical protein